MTPSVLQAMENVFASIPADEPQTMTSIMAFVEADPAFQNAAQGNLLADVLGRLEDDANNKYGRRSQQTYGEWFADTQSRVDSTMSSYTDKVSTATAMFQDDPVKLVQALQAVASNLSASMEDAIADWRAAEQTSKDFTGWRTPGSEAFDSSAVFGDASGSLEKAMRLQGSEVLSEIDLLIQDAKQRILDEEPEPEGGPVAQDTEVDAVQDVESFMNNLDDQQKLMKIQTDFGMQGAPASWMLGLLGFNDYTEMDRAKGKAISQFLQTPRVKNALIEDRESFNAFLEDPVVFMLESDAPYVVNWFNSDLGSTYAQLIGRQ
jgi:post-segregation antitoxin (ccd killing protein)